jgi:hypothetical protein
MVLGDDHSESAAISTGGPDLVVALSLVGAEPDDMFPSDGQQRPDTTLCMLGS